MDWCNLSKLHFIEINEVDVGLSRSVEHGDYWGSLVCSYSEKNYQFGKH